MTLAVIQGGCTIPVPSKSRSINAKGDGRIWKEDIFDLKFAFVWNDKSISIPSLILYEIH
jgi:hypothetical protein